MQLCGSLSILWHCLSFRLDGNWPFPILWMLLSFPDLLAFWWMIAGWFTASSFRNWNSSAGIPSAPLALFVAMLPKAHLTSHSRMSGSRWVIPPLWLSRSWRSFLYSSLYSCHLFLISSASVRSIQFLSFIEPILEWNVPLVSLIFLKRSLVFPILMFSSVSFHRSLRKAFLFLLIFCNSTFKWVYISFSPLPLAYFLSYLWGLLRQSFCFSFWGDGGTKLNHFSILALRTPWTVWKGKKIWPWKVNSLGCRCPVCYWRNNARKNDSRWSQSENSAQLWMWLEMEMKSDAVKNNIA